MAEGGHQIPPEQELVQFHPQEIEPAPIEESTTGEDELHQPEIEDPETATPADNLAANTPAIQTQQKICQTITKAAIILGIFLLISWFYLQKRQSYPFGSTRTTSWLYFVAATISGLGYGRINPTTSFQRVMTGLLQLIGQGLVAPPLQRIAGLCGRKISEKAKLPQRWKITLALFMVIAVLLVGMGIIARAEHVGTSRGFYISVGMTTGIGQTDLPLKSYFGEWFTIMWILFARCVFTQSMAYFCNTWL